MIGYAVSGLVCLYLLVDVLKPTTSIATQHQYVSCTQAYTTLNLYLCVSNPQTFDQVFNITPDFYTCKVDNTMYKITSKIQCNERQMIFKALKYDIIVNQTTNAINTYNQKTVVLKITNFIDILDWQNYDKSLEKF